MVKKNAIILLAGEGGHFEQAKRLFYYLGLDNKSEVFVYTDYLNKEIHESLKYESLGALRDKNGLSLVGAFSYFLKSFRTTLSYCFKYKVSVISTGPGISIIPSLVVKLFGGRVIHIETWSRFYSSSATGKIMYLIADKFYIQNKELLAVYPKGIYAGRL